ncbi:MAG: EAL domain-containing protein [Actinomycetota bacterium]|nr:EAL domain-containing protein [Actinomycetota bacterium]
MSAAFRHLPIAAWVLDASGVVRACSSAAEVLLGREPEEAVGVAFGELSGQPLCTPGSSDEPGEPGASDKPGEPGAGAKLSERSGRHFEPTAAALLRTRSGEPVASVLSTVVLDAVGRVGGGFLVTATPGQAVDPPGGQASPAQGIAAATAEQTGLPGRASMAEQVSLLLEACHAGTANGALALVRLDGLADVAATFGHEAGTEMLLAVAGRLKGGSDGAHFVGQLGEETLGVLISGPDSESVVRDAHRLGALLRAPVEIEGRVLACDASTGFALAQPGMGRPELQRRAETALAHSRQAGRGQAAEFSPDMAVQLSERLETESALRRALSGNELAVHYQPIVDLDTGHLVAVEALLRWNRPGIGMVPPDGFIPLAERSGLIVPIGRWVLEKSCVDAAHHGDGALPAEWAVSVNLSVRQLQDDRLARHVTEALERSGLATDRLQLEVTESMLAADPDAAEAALRRLKEIGVRIALDDFGTGYASLASLRRYPFDVLKIDKSFVAGVNSDPDDAAIVIATLKLAHSLGLCSVAEGVETPDQLHFLRRHGCDKFQGFLFSRPQPIEKLGGLLVATTALRPTAGPGRLEGAANSCSRSPTGNGLR